MRDLIERFLQDSGIDPVYFITCIVDVLALYLVTRLKLGLTTTQRSMYLAVIIVAVLLSAGVLCKVFGIIADWRELKSLWNS